MTTLLCAEHWINEHDHSVILPLVTKWLCGDEVQSWGHPVNNDALSGEVRESFWGHAGKRRPEQLRHRTNDEKEADRVVVRDIERAAEVLKEKKSAKNFEDIYRPRLARW